MAARHDNQYQNRVRVSFCYWHGGISTARCEVHLKSACKMKSNRTISYQNEHRGLSKLERIVA
jgi:hypothetical protein